MYEFDRRSTQAGASLATGQLRSPSSSGLTRGSMPAAAGGCRVDARVKPEHDGREGGAMTDNCRTAAMRRPFQKRESEMKS
ncbi:hypothetical protein REMIM1_CH02478 [Rhizobium etli bv. mimosae str. Mim1]|nr:hypothetical protein REMIM1_CH02478 [Rhizobium etli bv. mimosae str. Mim1]